MGLNRHLHYPMESPEAWHQFGDTLAPKSPWTALLSQPGLRSLTMEGYRSEAPHGRIQIHVEPSPKVSPGIYFGINHHFEFTEPNSGRKLMAILLQQWQVAQAFARQAAETLLNQV